MLADATPALLAYVAYLVWLLAGLCDFACHRHTDLPRTSGLAESRLHLLQLALIGGGIVLALAFAASAALAATLCLVAFAHAVTGYLDTRSAFPKRAILPVEQHVHSVLDMAPLIALFLWLVVNWPAITDGGGFHLRQPALPPAIWLATLAPAALLCVLPAALEFRAAWACRHAL
jgi:hypothetical protein